MKEKLLHRCIRVSMFKTSIILFEYTKKNCDIIGANYSKDVSGYTSDLTSGNVCIGIRKDSQDYDVAHECLHAANRIFNRIGHKIEVSNDEAQAYLLGYIYKKVIQEKDKLFNIKQA